MPSHNQSTESSDAATDALLTFLSRVALFCAVEPASADQRRRYVDLGRAARFRAPACRRVRLPGRYSTNTGIVLSRLGRVVRLNRGLLVHPGKFAPRIWSMVAGLGGGFLNRKHDGFPGPKTLWIGLQRAADLVLALEAQRSIGESYG